MLGWVIPFTKEILGDEVEKIFGNDAESVMSLLIKMTGKILMPEEYFSLNERLPVLFELEQDTIFRDCDTCHSAV